jgi:hypothetical protein
MLKQSLGSNYYRIDDYATPDQSPDIKKLDRVSVAATNTLKDRADHAAQSALGDPLFMPFREHQAGTPTFYYGSNKNTPEGSC